MQEYERTVTTGATSYVRPKIAKYIENLKTELNESSAEHKRLFMFALDLEHGLLSLRLLPKKPVRTASSVSSGMIDCGCARAMLPKYLFSIRSMYCSRQVKRMMSVYRFHLT